jgi:peptide/nickel transport system permease protein
MSQRRLSRLVLARMRVISLVALGATFLSHLLLSLAPQGADQLQQKAGVISGYVAWIVNLFRLNLGVTARGVDVGTALRGGIGVTAPLLCGAMLISIAVSLPPLLLRMSRKGRLPGQGLGHLLTVISFLPSVLLGYFAVLFWVHRFGRIPAWGIEKTPFIQAVGILFLPALVLGLGDGAAAELFGLSRVLVEEGMRQPFMQAVRARGASVPRHLLRYILAPVVASILSRVPLLLGGAIVIESVFTLPGIGFLTWRAAAERDAPMLMGVTLALVLASEIAVATGDVFSAALDPRQHVEGG